MNYQAEELKNGIKAHYIDTKKFKTNLLSFFITVPLSRETITKNALIPTVLRSGTNKLNTQEKISIELEKMYGAVFDCGIDKTGDNQIIKFYIELINDNYINKEEHLLEKAISLLLDIILNPLSEDNKFNSEYLNTEKNNLKVLIESKKDNKDRYASTRCTEEMYKNELFGLYKYGYVEDIQNINTENLYKAYIDLISNAKIDIFVSGDIDIKIVSGIIKNNENIKKLKPREEKHNLYDEKKELVEEKVVIENMDVTQGKLVIGLDLDENKTDYKYSAILYNVILGEGANSKLFQNVREKAGLAYSTRSIYIKQKNNIFIKCGIEIENYDKAVSIIRKQLKDMEEGKFSEEDLENAKKYMISGIQTIKDEQDSEMIYYFGQEISNQLVTFEEYIKKINKVTKNDIENIAKKLSINTIYFLRN